MFSIIIPCYNSENCIAKCLDSVLEQTYQNFEIVIINDGSTDRTLEIINEYVINNPNVSFKVVSIENGGIGNARNIGLENATRDYIWFIDADDMLYSNTALETTVKDITEHNPDIYIYSVYQTDFDKKDKYWYFSKQNVLTTVKQYPTLLLKQSWIWNRVMKREFILNCNVRFKNERMFEDMYFLADVQPMAKRIYITRDVKYIYVKHDNALTSNLSNFKTYPNVLWYSLKSMTATILKRKK